MDAVIIAKAIKMKVGLGIKEDIRNVKYLRSIIGDNINWSIKKINFHL